MRASSTTTTTALGVVCCSTSSSAAKNVGARATGVRVGARARRAVDGASDDDDASERSVKLWV